MEKDILKRLKGQPAANDRLFTGPDEKQIHERAKLLAAFIKGSKDATEAVIRKAKTKFGILGAVKSWEAEQFEKVDAFIDLSIFAAAQQDIIAGKSNNSFDEEEVIKSLHSAMDRVARDMPQMMGTKK